MNFFHQFITQKQDRLQDFFSYSNFAVLFK